MLNKKNVFLFCSLRTATHQHKSNKQTKKNIIKLTQNDTIQIKMYINRKKFNVFCCRFFFLTEHVIWKTENKAERQRLNNNTTDDRERQKSEVKPSRFYIFNNGKSTAHLIIIYILLLSLSSRLLYSFVIFFCLFSIFVCSIVIIFSFIFKCFAFFSVNSCTFKQYARGKFPIKKTLM